MGDYKSDREWTDKILPRIKQMVGHVLGPLLCDVASETADKKENSDLIFTAQDKRIAVRIRDARFFQRYGCDITFRLNRTSGAETEFSKLQRNLGHYFVYGHADEQQDAVMHAVVVDLRAFSDAWADETVRQTLKFIDRPNKDGKTSLRAFDMRSFPPNSNVLVYASQGIRAALGTLEPSPSTHNPPPDLQLLVRTYKTWDLIPPDAWARFDRERDEWHLYMRQHAMGRVE